MKATQLSIPGKKNEPGCPRRGVATVEAVVCLPILLVLFLGVIECCDVIFVQQGLAVSSYEGVRVAIVPGATNENVEAQVLNILGERNIVGGTISIEPSNFSTLPAGSHVTVRVTAPAAENTTVGLGLFSSRNLIGSTTMMTEF